jgi:hypothetical protein
MTTGPACGGKVLRPEPDDHALGRSRGGPSTKTHLSVDRRGWPLSARLTPGQAGDNPQLSRRSRHREHRPVLAQRFVRHALEASAPPVPSSGKASPRPSSTRTVLRQCGLHSKSAAVHAQGAPRSGHAAAATSVRGSSEVAGSPRRAAKWWFIGRWCSGPTQRRLFARRSRHRRCP